MYILYIAITGILISMYNFIILIKHFTMKYSFNLILGSLFQLMWIFTNTVMIFVDNNFIFFVLSQFATLFLIISIYLLHYYFDNLTTNFETRWSIIIATIIMGIAVAFTFNINSIFRYSTGYVGINQILAGFILFQGFLFIYRIIIHIGNQSLLSEHYGIFSMQFYKMRKYNLPVSIFFIFISAIYIVYNKYMAVYPFFIIIPIIFFVIFGIISKDPLIGSKIGQPLQAIALISKKKAKFVHIFAAKGYSVVEKEDFGQFIHEISGLLKNLTDSESSLKSFKTENLEILVEPVKDDMLILILKESGPYLLKLLHQLSIQLQNNNIHTNEEFVKLVNQNFLNTENVWKIKMQDIDKSYLFIINPQSAKHEMAKSLWWSLINEGTKITLDELNLDKIAKLNPSHIIIVGGDGTVHHTMNFLLKNNIDVPIAILPAGGGNDIFKRIKKKHENYSQIYLRHPVFEISVDNIPHAYAINTIEWGIGSYVAMRRDRNEARLLKGKTKYFYLVIKSLRQYIPWHSKVIIDSNEIVFDKLSAALIGFGQSTIAGGVVIFPGHQNDVDKSFIMLGRDYSRLNGLVLLGKLANGTHLKEKKVIYQQFNESVHLISNNVNIPLTVDGEVSVIPPCKITIVPDKITTFVIV